MAKPGRNPMAGRHATGGQTARPGGIHGGQAEPASNKGGGITGVSRSSPIRTQAPRPPVLTDQARTSAGAQRIIPRPPMPFENPQGSLNVSAPVHPYFNTQKSKDNVYFDKGSPVDPNQKAGGYKATSASIHNGTATTDDMFAAVGEPRAPKGYNPINSGFPTRGNQRQAGRPGKSNQGTSARENARVRQTGF